jgi:light-regulated signal transduction histidine kinase (bacteriophytochrome)
VRGDRESAGASQNEYIRAILNILEDFAAEKDRFRDTQRAVLNVLDDYGSEKGALERTQRALINILEDFGAEKVRLEGTQKAMLNLLEDFDSEKSKVESTNEELRREIAERELVQKELTGKGLALARSNAELEQFAYVASHDLQEPLRMVSSYVQLFATRYQRQLDAQADKYIHYAVEGATRMQALIAGLLEYSRLSQQAERERVETSAVLQVALANLKSSLEDSGAVVTYDPLPPVVGDSGQLVQVFQNLLSNALKFRREGEIPRVHVSGARDGSACLFQVRDNGIGMDNKYLDRIFVIFQRLHTRAEYPGTGIGLSICKKIVEKHGGRIWVESEFGNGSTFFFTLEAA